MIEPIFVADALPNHHVNVVFTSARRTFEVAWDGLMRFVVVDANGAAGNVAAEFVSRGPCDPPPESVLDHHIACSTNSGQLRLSAMTAQPPFYLTAENDVVLTSVNVELTTHVCCVWDLPDAKAYHGTLELLNDRARRFRRESRDTHLIQQIEDETTDALRHTLSATALVPGLLFPCTVDLTPAVAEVAYVCEERIGTTLHVLASSKGGVRDGSIIARRATVETIDEGCSFETILGRVRTVI